MKTIIKTTGILYALSFTFVPTLTAQMGSSVNIPSGGGAVQTDPPDEKVKLVPKAEVKANREAKKIKAKKRNQNGRTAPAQNSQIPVNPMPDVPTTVTP